jgi:hypothetical protein
MNPTAQCTSETGAADRAREAAARLAYRRVVGADRLRSNLAVGVVAHALDQLR